MKTHPYHIVEGYLRESGQGYATVRGVADKTNLKLGKVRKALKDMDKRGEVRMIRGWGLRDGRIAEGNSYVFENLMRGRNGTAGDL